LPNSPTWGFGKVRDGGTRAHQGNDLLAPVGTIVTAADDGEVLSAGDNGDHGTQVIIGHRNEKGEMVSYTSYSHLSALNVKVGSTVEAGDAIGLTGKTGNANSPTIPAHLHFEIRTANPPRGGLEDRLDPQKHLVKPEED
jgi:murein DD-endopeptidase MepM/ murein hydrolase activator NlpD